MPEKNNEHYQLVKSTFGTTSANLGSARGGHAGFDTFAEQVAFQLGDACEQGCHHATVRGVEFECQALHCNQ